MELGGEIMPNRLRNFLGKKPVEYNGISFYSPTIDMVDEIGEIQYNIYLTLATFNKEDVLKYIFGVSDEDYALIENEDDYLVLTSIPSIIKEISDALSFFIRKEVSYDSLVNSFNVENKFLLNKENYTEVANLIKEQNGILDDSNRPKKFKNEKARQMYEKLQKLREKYKKKSSSEEVLSIKDMLSILCNAEGNGINIFNVGQLTIYQVYEHFERLSIKEQHTRLLRVWANGYLGENQQLPEWIVKSKL